MKRLILVGAVALLAACAREDLDGGPADSILGGSEVGARSAVARHVVAIHGFDGAHAFLCTGVLIAKSQVLTAGHCTSGLRAGEIVFSASVNGKVRRKIVRARVQPRFAATVERVENRPNRDPKSIKNWGDLAVMEFEGEAPASYSPVAIAPREVLTDGETVLLAGYGETDGHDSTPSDKLQSVTVRVLKARYSKSEFTVDQREGKGACHGDSGGPAFVVQGGDLLLAGITSRGFDEVCEKATIYTAVSEFQDWIAQAAGK